jgi:hypothetical protein
MKLSVGFYRILEHRLDHLEMFQGLVMYERGKSAPVVETNTGSW